MRFFREIFINDKDNNVTLVKKTPEDFINNLKISGIIRDFLVFAEVIICFIGFGIHIDLS